MSAVKDMAGVRAGRLLVIERAESRGRGVARWLCNCDCGKSIAVIGADLRNGHTQSCGCLREEESIAGARRANTTHGMTDTSIYIVWRNMLNRCTKPAHKAYKDYGGRGIAVCQEWMDFQRFYDDFGRTRPSDKHSIDREDNNSGYHLGNVRWALPIQQTNNRRSNVHLTHDGRTQTAAQWAREAGISSALFYYRLKSGWGISKALNTPINTQFRSKAHQ